MEHKQIRNYDWLPFSREQFVNMCLQIHKDFINQSIASKSYKFGF